MGVVGQPRALAALPLERARGGRGTEWLWTLRREKSPPSEGTAVQAAAWEQTATEGAL